MTPVASSAADRNENQILLATRMVREHYFADQKNDGPDWILVLAIREFLDRFRPSRPEDLVDLLIDRSAIKNEGYLSRYVAASLAAEVMLNTGKAGDLPDTSVFTGGRRFSFAKVSAMAAFITLHGVDICKQKLNHLLFYADFVHFFLHDRSISGARYVRRAVGPVLHGYDKVLQMLVYAGVVRSPDRRWMTEDDAAILRDRMILGELTIHETVTMNWVLSNFGSMNSVEIGKYVHREIAHRFTRQDSYIAYEYAKLLQDLPDRSML